MYEQKSNLITTEISANFSANFSSIRNCPKVSFIKQMLQNSSKLFLANVSNAAPQTLPHSHACSSWDCSAAELFKNHLPNWVLDTGSPFFKVWWEGKAANTTKPHRPACSCQREKYYALLKKKNKNKLLSLFKYP